MKWKLVSTRSYLLLCLLIFSCAGSPTKTAETAEATGARVELADAGLQEQEGVRRIEPGDYFRPTQGGTAVIKLEGQKNVVLDLEGVVLRGTPEGSAPDQAQGIGIWIRNCVNVEVRGGTLGGYRVDLVIENCESVQVDGLRIDPGFGHRLGTEFMGKSAGKGHSLFGATPVKGLERSGAGIAVLDSSEIQVRGVHCRGGQNGLVLVRSESCLIEGNDFSYLSGFGIALENSDQNVVRDNHCDFITCSGDSGSAEEFGPSGFVLAGDCTGNLIASNWAQASSAGIRVLSGDEPCRANRIVGNDFSGSTSVSAVLRGSQDTWFLNNVLQDCQGGGLIARGTEGLALGNNQFNGVMGIGLQIDGGSRAAVRNNEFVDCDVAIEVRGSGAGTPSDHWIAQNSFSVNIQDLALDEVTGVEFFENDFQNPEPRIHLDGLSGEGAEDLTSQEIWSWLADDQGDFPSGRSYHSQLRAARAQAPAHWEAADSWMDQGDVTPVTPGQLRVEKLELGDFGPIDPARLSLRSQRAQGALERMTWDATWFTWDAESDPRGDLERWRAGRFEPLLRREVDFWMHPWGSDGENKESLPALNYGLIANGTLKIKQKGEYRLSTRSDDGVRVLIDGQPVLEDWSWHPERRTSEKITLEAGSHSIELEYFQLDGAAVLALDLDGPL
mgnify:CR=1 FL=1